MPIYDNLVFHRDFNLDHPLNYEDYNDDNKYRRWQTKDLNPSLDTYGLIPKSQFEETQEDSYYLCRRHPPEIEWTIQNQGQISYDGDLISSADHWRTVRYTGEITISDVSKDGCIYVFNLNFESGILNNSYMDYRESIVDKYLPEPPYSEKLDINKDIPIVKNTEYNVVDVSEIVYEDKNISDLLQQDISYDAILLALNYYNIKYKDH